MELPFVLTGLEISLPLVRLLDKLQHQPTVGQQASRDLLGSAWVLVAMVDPLTCDHLVLVMKVGFPRLCQDLSFG